MLCLLNINIQFDRRTAFHFYPQAVIRGLVSHMQPGFCQTFSQFPKPAKEPHVNPPSPARFCGHTVNEPTPSVQNRPTAPGLTDGSWQTGRGFWHAGKPARQPLKPLRQPTAPAGRSNVHPAAGGSAARRSFGPSQRLLETSAREADASKRSRRGGSAVPGVRTTASERSRGQAKGARTHWLGRDSAGEDVSPCCRRLRRRGGALVPAKGARTHWLGHDDATLVEPPDARPCRSKPSSRAEARFLGLSRQFQAPDGPTSQRSPGGASAVPRASEAVAAEAPSHGFATTHRCATMPKRGRRGCFFFREEACHGYVA